MKKLLFILIMLSFFMGCTAIKEFKQSEFAKEDAMYVNWDHMKFSIWGYKHPTEETYEKSVKEGWWGAPVPYIPAK